MKGSMVHYVSLIPTEMMRAAIDNAVVRFHHIVERQGMHIECIGVSVKKNPLLFDF